MQADNAVREETWLYDLEALDRYTQAFTLVGGGGTDFPPRLRPHRRAAGRRALAGDAGGALLHRRQGHLPAKRPPFEVAFLFLENGEPPPEVPPWAMRLVLQPEEFLQQPKG